MSKIGFLFPGQGAQSVGMGRDLFATLPAAKRMLDQASEILGYDLGQICLEGPAEKLDSTVYSQPALFVTSLAAVEKLKVENPSVVEECQGAAGLSLGEYSALVFAGALSFADGVRLVQKRGEAMQAAADAIPSGMISVLGMERGKIEQLCEEVKKPGEVLQIANLLCPGNIVVSGDLAACERLTPVAEASGAMRTIKLTVAGAFHTPIMQPAVERLSKALKQIEFQTPRIPIYSNVDARAHSKPEEIRDLLVRQVCSPVMWEDCILAMLADGYDHFFEVGTGRVLRGLLKRISRKIPCDGTLDV